MRTPAEMLEDLRRALDPMENDSLAIIEYATLLTVLTSDPDAEVAMDGIHRLMFEIRGHAENLKKQWEASAQLVKRLANP